MRKSFLLFLFVFFMVFISCKTQEVITTKRNVKLNKTYTSESGLQYMFTAFGNDVQAKIGDKVSVHYTGKLTDGKEFDNSYKKGYPISFVIGDGKVIKGLNEGVALMNAGDKAVLTIPSKLGYGSIEIPGMIPANSVLIFDVELVEILAQ